MWYAMDYQSQKWMRYWQTHFIIAKWKKLDTKQQILLFHFYKMFRNDQTDIFVAA